MPQTTPKDHKCSHHTAAMDKSIWRKFHFSGKVIMCSVLFGLGLVLVGGLVLAIGEDEKDDEKSDKQTEIQNKAPMSIVGPVIMGIGGFTVIVGIIMCLFETNICRKKGPDSRPLIDEQAANAEIPKSSDQISVPSPKRDKRKHRRVKNSLENSSKHRSPRDFTSSENFLTPPSSFIPESNAQNSNLTTGENSKTLIKSISSSGKSWTTSTEFQTPASSLQESVGSFEERMESSENILKQYTLEIPETNVSGLSPNEFLSPINSYVEGPVYAQISADVSSSGEDTKQSTIPVISENTVISENIDANEEDLKSKSENSQNDSSAIAKNVSSVPEIVERRDENSAVNHEIEVLDRCLEDIEQLKASQVPVQIDSINVNEQSNITTLNDTNTDILNNIHEQIIPNGT